MCVLIVCLVVVCRCLVFVCRCLLFQCMTRRFRNAIQISGAENWDISSSIVTLTVQAVEFMFPEVDLEEATLPTWRRYAADTFGCRRPVGRCFWTSR